MGKTISFINMKGGVGKTTLAVNVGYTLSKEFDKKVLLIDVDPQMNATQYTLNEDQTLDIMNNPEKSIYGILKEKPLIPPLVKDVETPESSIESIIPIADNFDIIPSHLSIMSLDLNNNPFTLLRFVDKLRDSYDVIIIDSPPTISAYTKISLLASDAYVVPMKTEALSLLGLPLLQNHIENLKEQFDQELLFLGIVLTMVNPEYRVYTDIKDKISQNPEWKEKLFDSELKQRTLVTRALSPESRSRNLPYIIELDNSELYQQMIGITEEFMQRLRL
jgi:chromosome partitioning protein